MVHVLDQFFYVNCVFEKKILEYYTHLIKLKIV
jgi:hypothetical protein